jgi:hypothetical protein
MLVTIASVALALQLGSPAHSSSTAEPVVQQVQYRVYAHPPPCGHGWDLSARDGMCYQNGVLPPEDQAAFQHYYRRGPGNRGYGGGPGYDGRVYGRYAVPCGGDGVDLDIRDGRCYPNGMVPQRFQDLPENYGRY